MSKLKINMEPANVEMARHWIQVVNTQQQAEIAALCYKFKGATCPPLEIEGEGIYLGCFVPAEVNSDFLGELIDYEMTNISNDLDNLKMQLR